MKRGSFKSVYVELGGMIIDMESDVAVSGIEYKIESLHALTSKL